MSAIIRIDPKLSQSYGVAERVQISGMTPEQYESSLERQNFSQVKKLDFKKECYFADYLAPNERTPSKAREKPNWLIPGILYIYRFSASLFDLVLVDPVGTRSKQRAIDAYAFGNVTTLTNTSQIKDLPAWKKNNKLLCCLVKT